MPHRSLAIIDSTVTTESKSQPTTPRPPKIDDSSTILKTPTTHKQLSKRGYTEFRYVARNSSTSRLIPYRIKISITTMYMPITQIPKQFLKLPHSQRKKTRPPHTVKTPTSPPQLDSSK
jgi:hypothetical protein